MKAIIVRHGAAPEVIELPEGDKLDVMQKLIGGYLEAFFSFESPGNRCVTFMCDEEAKLKAVPPLPNRYCPPREEVILGPILISASDEEGSTVGMNDAEIEDTFALLRTWPGTQVA